MIKRLVFVRHGITRDNTECLFSGSRNPGLESTGYEQAERAARSLGIQPDIILSSPKQRALATAWTIAGLFSIPRSSVISEPLLRERSYGDLEGKPHVQLDETTEEAERYVAQMGAEPLSEVYVRQQLFLQKLQESTVFDNLTILAVGHNAAGRALLRVVRGLPCNGTVESIPNATPIQLWTADEA